MTTKSDIISYVESWREANGIGKADKLAVNQVIKLAEDIQIKIGELSYKAPVEGASIIPFSGKISDYYAYEIAKALSKTGSDHYCYIGDFDAGELINSKEFEQVLIEACGDEETARRLLFGAWVDGVRTKFSTDGVLSIVDFVSGQAITELAHGDVLVAIEGITGIISKQQLDKLNKFLMEKNIEERAMITGVTYHEKTVEEGYEGDAKGNQQNNRLCGERIIKYDGDIQKVFKTELKIVVQIHVAALFAGVIVQMFANENLMDHFYIRETIHLFARHLTVIRTYEKMVPNSAISFIIVCMIVFASISTIASTILMIRNHDVFTMFYKSYKKRAKLLRALEFIVVFFACWYLLNTKVYVGTNIITRSIHNILFLQYIGPVVWEWLLIVVGLLMAKQISDVVVLLRKTIGK